MVEIYAPKQVTQRIALWGSLLNDPEQIAWDSLAMEVLKLDVWTWLHGNDPGFTF